MCAAGADSRLRYNQRSISPAITGCKPMKQEQEHAFKVSKRFESEAFAILDFACPGRPCNCAEEMASANEIVLPKEGAYVRRNRYESVFADATRVVFFDARDPFEIHHPINKPDKSTVLSLNPAYSERFGLVNAETGVTGFGVGSVPIDYQTATQHFHLLRLLNSENRESRLQIEEHAILLIDRVLGLRKQNGSCPFPSVRRGKASTLERNMVIVQRTLELLNQRFRERVSLDETARYAGCSTFHLCRIFRQHTGWTVSRYLAELRLQTALGMLRRSRMAITDIALELGYSSHSHFSAHFKSVFGLTPREYRK